MFEQVKIILVGTSHPGNIGAAARALKTMSFSQLVLVAPKKFPDDAATAMASNAEDILAKTVVVDSLSEAIADSELILGTSARSRYLDWPVLSPRQVAQETASYLTQSTARKAAIVFGRERTGLTNEELQLCHAHVYIPCNPDYSSLNIASAVQILCYELRLALTADLANTEPLPEQATSESMEQLYQHLEQALLAIDFINHKAPKQVMNRLKRLLQRARCEPEEVGILRGLCAKILKYTRVLNKDTFY